MSIKHHQANVSSTLRDAGDAIVQKHNATVSVYDTNFSFPGNGADYYIFNSALGGASGPSLASPNDANKVGYGKVGNLFFDWEGGGPESATTEVWQTTLQGKIWGFNGLLTPNNVTFKIVYSGGIVLSTSDLASDYETSPSGNLTDVLIDDWDQDNTSGVQVREVTTSIGGASHITNGACAFRLRYWNRSNKPHLVCFVKREDIDADFILMGASCLTSDYNPTSGDTYATTKTELTDVISWQIDREHDSVPTASILLFVDNTDAANAYDPSTEYFGNIRKGNYIEIEAGYGGTETKRFIGNISGSTQVSREADGAYITLHCEGIEGWLLDSKNFNYPNNAMYSYAGYYSDTSVYYQPNGVERPVAFDQWNMVTAIKAVALNAGVDHYYLDQYRKFYEENGTVTTSDTKLLRDLNINLSRTNLVPNNNINLPEQEYLWVYDFGQDTAYDIIKDILSKYGYYLGSVGGGDECGSLEIVEVESPTDIVTKINTGLSSNYTEGVATEYAEGFLSTEMGAGSSYVVANWTGSGANILMGVGPSTSTSVQVHYKVDSGDPDWTAVAGYYNDYTEYYTRIMNTEYLNTDYNLFSYENVNSVSGGNPSVFRLIFNRDDEGNPIPLPYGDHLIRLYKTTTDKAYFEGILGFDYGADPYKEYSTYNVIKDLNIEYNASDIRNDIVVLGAPKGSFAFVADEEDQANVKEKYVTSRAVDPRSIYDPNYKFYIGRRKQFIIEDPTIVTQERADWLAIHTLAKYRVTANSGTIAIPCDLGLQVYDNIKIEEVQTGSVDSNASVFVNKIIETYSKDEYSNNISYLTNWVPPSFRRRQQLDLQDIIDYFNGSPIAFEKMTVPILDGNTGYDPMSAEDGRYIDLEWTLLVPGIHSLEIYDTLNSDRIPSANAGSSPNELVAVPFVGVYEFPGKYRARWDGVHEGYDLNSKFNGTKYADIYHTPDGNGWAARGQNTSIIDAVNVIAYEEDDPRAKKQVVFPLYPIMRFEPLYEEHGTLSRVVRFGCESGTGISNGVTITAGDYEGFDIEHFDLEERQKVYWDFDYQRFGAPSDQDDFLVYTRHATDVQFSELLNLVFIREPSRSQEFQENNDITHRIMACDPKRPFGETISTGPFGKRRPNNMPMIDETVGVRLFSDGEYTKDRRYFIHTAKLHVNILTHMVDEVTYACDSYRYGFISGGAAAYQWRTFSQPRILTRRFNYSFVQSVAGIDFSEFFDSNQTLYLNKWTFIPKIGDSTTSESVIFETVLKNNGNILDHIEGAHTINNDSPIAGIGVGKVFAMEINHMTDSALNDYNFMRNTGLSYNIAQKFKAPNGKLSRFPTREFMVNHAEDVFSSPNDFAAYYYNDIGTRNQWLENWNGTSWVDRKIYNSIVLSIEMVIFDRLGRAYYSSAKTDEGRVRVGRYNDVEFHSEIGREMCQYVNRWDPYLPTACYFENEPATLSLTEIGGPTCSRFHAGTFKSYNPDFDGVNLTDNIMNYYPNQAAEDLETPVTTTYPVKPVQTHKVRGQTYLHHVNRIGLPRMCKSESSDGALLAFFGDTYNQHNSKIWHADAVANPSRRDHTTDSNLGPWGLPLYVCGGFTNRYIDLIDLGGGVFGVRNELDGFNMPEFYRNNYAWSNHYIREYNNSWPGVYGASGFTNNRCGLYTFFKHMPVFTLVGGGRHTLNVAY